MSAERTSLDRYLGDGVYASFDGWHIWLAVNHHDNKVVALEPSVLSALVDYARDISKTETEATGSDDHGTVG